MYPIFVVEDTIMVGWTCFKLKRILDLRYFVAPEMLHPRPPWVGWTVRFRSYGVRGVRGVRQGWDDQLSGSSLSSLVQEKSHCLHLAAHGWTGHRSDFPSPRAYKQQTTFVTLKHERSSCDFLAGCPANSPKQNSLFFPILVPYF